MDGSTLRLLVRRIPLVAAASLVSACSDGPVGPEDDMGGDALTEAEAVGLAQQLGLEALGFGMSRASPSPSRSATAQGPLSAESVSLDYSLTRPCLLGGSVTSTGHIDVLSDDATQLAIVDLTATEVHHACVFTTATTRVTVTGDPDVTTTIHASSQYGEAFGTQSVAVLGAVTWVTDDGRNGRCAIDVLVEVDADNDTSTTRGELCGFSFDVTVTGTTGSG